MSGAGASCRLSPSPPSWRAYEVVEAEYALEQVHCSETLVMLIDVCLTCRLQTGYDK